MRVGTTKTERVDTGSGNALGPLFGLGNDLKVTA